MVISQLIESYFRCFEDKKETYMILGEILKKDTAYFLAHKDNTVDREDILKFIEYAKRRIKKEPLAYILNKAHFYGLEFFVQPGILIPRNDTETLVDKAIDYAKAIQNPKILDLACGSGCIGISLAKNIQSCSVALSDISKDCVIVAQKNIELNNAHSCNVIQSDLFENLSGVFDMIVSNPPYISTEEYVMLDKQVVDYEPELALLGGEEGTEFYEMIAKQAKEFLNIDGVLLFEVGHTQADRVRDILCDHGYEDIRITKDLNGIDRVVSAIYAKQDKETAKI